MKRSTNVIVSNLSRDNILFPTFYTGLFLLFRKKNWGRGPSAPPLATALSQHWHLNRFLRLSKEYLLLWTPKTLLRHRYYQTTQHLSPPYCILFYSELKKFKTAQPHGLMWRHKIPKELLSFFWLVNLTIRHFVLKNSPIKSLNRSDLFWATLVAYRWAWARPLQWPTSYKGLNSDIFVYLQPTT